MNSINQKTRVYSVLSDIAFFFAGSILFAVSINCFTAPNNIAAGGLAGIGTILNYLWEIPIGTTILILNIPLFIWAYFSLGFRFIGRTVIGTVLSSITIDLLEIFSIPVYSGDKILAAIFGGLFSGAGLALILMRGATTGGTDLLARLLSKRFRATPMGRMILFLDMAVILFAAFAYRNIEAALYAVVSLYVGSSIIDAVLYGSDAGKVLFIVSQNPEEVSVSIMHTLCRGITVWNGKGAFTGGNTNILMCAVRRNEVFRVRDILNQIDPSAFIIIGDAAQILGEGFKEIEEKNK